MTNAIKRPTVAVAVIDGQVLYSNLPGVPKLVPSTSRITFPGGWWFDFVTGGSSVKAGYTLSFEPPVWEDVDRVTMTTAQFTCHKVRLTSIPNAQVSIVQKSGTEVTVQVSGMLSQVMAVTQKLEDGLLTIGGRTVLPGPLLVNTPNQPEDQTRVQMNGQVADATLISTDKVFVTNAGQLVESLHTYMQTQQPLQITIAVPSGTSLDLAGDWLSIYVGRLSASLKVKITGFCDAVIDQVTHLDLEHHADSIFNVREVTGTCKIKQCNGGTVLVAQLDGDIHITTGRKASGMIAVGGGKLEQTQVTALGSTKIVLAEVAGSLTARVQEHAQLRVKAGTITSLQLVQGGKSLVDIMAEVQVAKVKKTGGKLCLTSVVRWAQKIISGQIKEDQIGQA